MFKNLAGSSDYAREACIRMLDMGSSPSFAASCLGIDVSLYTVTVPLIYMVVLKYRHVFGFMEQGMDGLFVRTVGITGAKANVALTSLVYNICRFCQIVRYHGNWPDACKG